MEKSRFLWRSWGYPLVLAFTLINSSHAAEFTAHWIGTTNGNWYDNSNWDVGTPDNVGNNVYDVIWDDHPVIVTLNKPLSLIQVRNFTFSSGGVLTGAIPFLVTGDLLWSAGEMRGPAIGYAVTTVNGNTTLSANAGQFIGIRNRGLNLGPLTTLDSPFWLYTEPGAAFPSSLRVYSTATLNLAPGASLKVFPLNSQGAVSCTGIMRILDSTVDFDSEANLLISSTASLLDIGNRTANFAPGAGILLENGRIVLHGARIPFVPPSGGATTNGGTVLVKGGSIFGNGEVGRAQLGLDAPEGTESDSFVSGEITFGELVMNQRGVYSVTILGRNTGEFDHLTVQNKLRINAKLRVQVSEAVAQTIQASDVFEILTVQPGCDAAGEFANVPIGQRIETEDGIGTFLVDYTGPGSGSIVLRDFKGIPFRVSGTFAPLDYLPFEQSDVGPGLGKKGPLAIASEALVTSRPNLDWTGVSLVVDIAEGSDPAQDILAVRGQSIALVGDRVIYGGSLDIGSWSSTGAQLWFEFNSNSSEVAVQELIRSIYYFNSSYFLEAFITGQERWADRRIHLNLSNGHGFQEERDTLISFPYVTGIHFENDRLFVYSYSQSQVVLFSDFSDGISRRLPQLLVTVKPTCFSEGLKACLHASDSSVVTIGANFRSEEGPFPVDAHAGPFSTRACVKAYTYNQSEVCGLTITYVYGLSGSGDYADCFNAPPLALSVSQTPFTLAPFYALQSLMNQTTEGRRLANLYRQHTPEVVRVLSYHPDLMPQVAAVLGSFEPSLAALLSGNGSSSTINYEMIDELNATWMSLASYASPALKTAMMQERSRFNNFYDFAFKDFSEWADMLQIPSPTSPWLEVSGARFDGGTFAIEANAIQGKQLSLWRTLDLKGWEQAAGAQIQITGGTATLTDPSPDPQKRFYQVRGAP